MAKITVGAVSYEGSIEEIKALMAMQGVEFPEEEPLKVGDYVKIIGGFEGISNVGGMYKIVEDDGTECPYKLEDLSGEYTGWKKYENLEKVCDEEVAEARAKLAGSDKWAKIGRKPNEFKKGDIVISTENGVYPKNTIGEVTEFMSDGLFRVEADGLTKGNWHSHENVELITPVEARFDA